MKDKNLVNEVQKLLEMIDQRIRTLPCTMHTVTVSWGGKEQQFDTRESIKLPEYVEKFRFFLDYPVLEDNGLSENDVSRLKELARFYQTATDDILLANACLHEEDVWKPVGKILTEVAFNILPEHICLTLEDGRYTEILVDEAEDKYQFRIIRSDLVLARSLYFTKCLRKVENEIEDEDGNIKKVNIHRFFDLVPNNMLDISLDIGARFGKIGEKGMNLIDDGEFWKSPKPSQFFWLLYYQKLKEGYQDLTSDLMNGNDPVEQLFAEEKEPKLEEDDPAIEFYTLVIEGAKNALDEFGNDWLRNPNPFNGRMLNSCWKTYTAISEAIDINTSGLEEKDAAQAILQTANTSIKKMVAVINPPFKKGVTVDSFLIDGKNIHTIEDARSTIADVLTEWETKLNAMEALTSTTEKQQKASQKLSPFGTVRVTRPTEEQMQWIKDLVAKTQPKYVPLIRKAYMLDPIERRQVYEEALEKAENKTEEHLFHGTQTGNVASITTCGGPTIHVAAANGRAFGNGSYWSHDPDKSAGYSSYARYSRWAHGSSNEGWLFIGRIHYGKAYDPYGSYDGKSTEEAVKKGGYDCCHAKPGRTVLQRDEIITYDEEHSYVEAVIMIGDAADE